MQSSKEILNTIDYSPKAKVNTIDYRDNKLSIKEADQVIKEVTHLIDNPQYKPYFYKKLYLCGKDKFLMIAKRAEEGNNPPRLFVSLLKEYCK